MSVLLLPLLATIDTTDYLWESINHLILLRKSWKDVSQTFQNVMFIWMMLISSQMIGKAIFKSYINNFTINPLKCEWAV